jgi:hypothetical protein
MASVPILRTAGQPTRAPAAGQATWLASIRAHATSNPVAALTVLAGDRDHDPAVVRLLTAELRIQLHDYPTGADTARDALDLVLRQQPADPALIITAATVYATASTLAGDTAAAAAWVQVTALADNLRLPDRALLPAAATAICEYQDTGCRQGSRIAAALAQLHRRKTGPDAGPIGDAFDDLVDRMTAGCASTSTGRPANLLLAAPPIPNGLLHPATMPALAAFLPFLLGRRPGKHNCTTGDFRDSTVPAHHRFRARTGKHKPSGHLRR